MAVLYASAACDCLCCPATVHQLSSVFVIVQSVSLTCSFSALPCSRRSSRKWQICMPHTLDTIHSMKLLSRVVIPGDKHKASKDEPNTNITPSETLRRVLHRRLRGEYSSGATEIN